MRFNVASPTVTPTVAKVNTHFELFAFLTTSFGSDKYYEKLCISDLVARLQAVPPQFAVKAIAYASQVMQLREMPLVAAVLMCKLYSGRRNDNGVQYGTLALLAAINRCDQMAEALAIAQNLLDCRKTRTEMQGAYEKKYTSVRKIPAQMRKALKYIFENDRFKEYHYSKWEGAKHDIRLKDVLFLVRPKPKNDAQAELFKKIANSQLTRAETHERVIGTIQSQTEDEEVREGLKAEAYTELISNGKMGALAVLRQLKAMLLLRNDALNEAIITCLNDMRYGKKGVKLFPHQVFIAMEMLEGQIINREILQRVFKALNDYCMDAVNALLPGLQNPVIMLDCSGSMEYATISEKSKATRKLAAGSMAFSLYCAHPNSIIMLWANYANAFTGVENSPYSVYSKAANQYGKLGGGTDFGEALKQLNLLAQQHKVDTVVVFTDMEFNGPRLEADLQYGKLSEKMFIFFDVGGYKEHGIQVKRNHVIVPGLSFAGFELAAKLTSKGVDGLVDEINNFFTPGMKNPA